MGPFELVAIIFAILFLLLFSGQMVWSAMALVSLIISLFLLPTPSLEAMGWLTWSTTFNFLLVCLPLFLLMGSLVSESGLSQYLFDGLSILLRRIPGGLLHSVLVGAAIFGAASGASTADAATMTVVSYPELKRRGYDRKLALGALAAGSTVDILIPPSLTMILYSWVTNVSLGKLFMAGIMPGVVMVLIWMGTVSLIAKVSPGKIPREQAVASKKEKVRAAVVLLPYPLLVGVVLGSIYTGFATPTEAAAIGVCVVLVLTIGLRKLNWGVIKRAMVQSLQVNSMIMMIVVVASMLIYGISYLKLSEAVTEWTLNHFNSPYGLLFAIYVVIILLGCVVESFLLLLLTVPLIHPTIVALGFDPIWFGIVYVTLVQIGLITPPAGLHLYVVKGVVKESSVSEIASGCFPFLLGQFVTLVLITIFPQIVLWLPGQMR